MIDRIKNKIFKLKSSEYVRNVTTLVSGTTGAQLISLITAPILYRLYSKDDYGTLGTYISILGVIGVFSTLRYNEAILLDKDDNEAKKILWLTRFINLTCSISSFLVFIFLSSEISTLLNNTNLEPWLLLLPVSIFFSGQNEIYKVWANRKKEYKMLTINSILTSILIPLFSITYGMLYNNILGLFLGLLVSHIFPTLLLHFSLNKKYNLSYDSSYSTNSFKEIARKHKNFPIYSLPADFINRLTNQLPVFMLSANYGASTVGIYNLCTRMLGLPMQLISSSFSTIFKEKSVKDYLKNGNCKNIFVKTSKYLFAIALFPLMITLIFGPTLFRLFFGIKWEDAGTYAQLLSPMYFFNFVVSPLTYTYYILKKQKEDLIFHLIFLLVTFSLFYFSNNIKIERMLLMYSLSFSCLYILYYIRSLKFASGQYKSA